ncbi:class I SAM-dependent methyltransferase [Streptosporangium nondiastaticum]|uniref:Class I SAM-dependent methyltransferase n=2 Tax=Streptosporangium nondiastaticum TaxID=35764 RepID=A0A9X7JUA7_9ACTN|nr:class I SAM-dependent methyltransferase [Streptosporangium nondiastaticum]
MTSGYYDYDAYAAELTDLLQGRRDVLELGVGTGLVCERLLRCRTDGLHLTGLDHTESMLAQARARLGERVQLLNQDIQRLDLPASFDGAFSVGGVWAHYRTGAETPLGSHLPDHEGNVNALRRLHAALRPGAVLLIAVQRPHDDYEHVLPNGLVYEQTVKALSGDRLVKDYCLRQDRRVVAHQQCVFRVLAESRGKALLQECGFRFTGVSPKGNFYAYAKSS